MARQTSADKQPHIDDLYFPISALSIIPGTAGQFDLYFKRRGNYVLYAHGGDIFSREKLAEILDVWEFYVRVDQKMAYESYLAKNLGDLLQNEDVPIQERAKIFYGISTGAVRKVFDSKLPRTILPEAHKKLLDIVNASLLFLTKPDALKNVSQFISHAYHSFSHSVNVLVLTLSVIQSFPGVDKKVMTEVGLGCLLHDIGKIEVLPDILVKAPENLSADEWDVIKTHPAKGLRFCANLPLSQRTANCILFHHERMDGKGYPGGLSGEDLPFEARAVAACNVYDNLTTDKLYAKALSPFDALQYMKEKMPGVFAPDIFKRLVFVLGDAGVAQG